MSPGNVNRENGQEEYSDFDLSSPSSIADSEDQHDARENAHTFSLSKSNSLPFSRDDVIDKDETYNTGNSVLAQWQPGNGMPIGSPACDTKTSTLFSALPVTTLQVLPTHSRIQGDTPQKLTNMADSKNLPSWQRLLGNVPSWHSGLSTRANSHDFSTHFSTPILRYYCTCTHTHTHVHKHTHTHTHIHTHTNAHRHTHAHSHTHKHTHTDTHTRTCKHTYTHTHTHTCACAHTHTHTHIHIHMQTHTHTHTQTHANTHTRPVSLTHRRKYTHTM